MNNTPLLEEYYAQNAKKIRNMVDKILSGFGGVTQKDYDDFYSLANEVLWTCCEDMTGNRGLIPFCTAVCPIG